MTLQRHKYMCVFLATANWNLFAYVSHILLLQLVDDPKLHRWHSPPAHFLVFRRSSLFPLFLSESVKLCTLLPVVYAKYEYESDMTKIIGADVLTITTYLHLDYRILFVCAIPFRAVLLLATYHASLRFRHGDLQKLIYIYQLSGWPDAIVCSRRSTPRPGGRTTKQI